MLSIPEFKELCQTLVDNITELSDHVIVAEDNQATKKLADKQKITLVGVIPTSDSDGRPGIRSEKQTALFFVVKKHDTSAPEATELADFSTTQQAVIALRDYILTQQEDNGCSIFFRLVVTSITITPEYNIFGGFLGWSINFVF